MITTIIFDLDGLLVDSQPIQYKAYNQIFSLYGYPLSRDDWYEWIHRSLSTEDWIKQKALPLDPYRISQEKRKLYSQLVPNELQLKKGAIELVNSLKDEYSLAVASASSIESIELMLNKFGLRTAFDEIFSDVTLERRKPNPDIFLHTAKEMNTVPAECLVIEDSLAGLQAAKAAGMKCIVCPDTFCPIDPAEYKGYDLIVESLLEVNAETIRALNQSK